MFIYLSICICICLTWSVCLFTYICFYLYIYSYYPSTCPSVRLVSLLSCLFLFYPSRSNLPSGIISLLPWLGLTFSFVSSSLTSFPWRVCFISIWSQQCGLLYALGMIGVSMGCWSYSRTAWVVTSSSHFHNSYPFLTEIFCWCLQLSLPHHLKSSRLVPDFVRSPMFERREYVIALHISPIHTVVP